jgi:hypothetical protein
MFARVYPAGLVAMMSLLALPLACEPSLVVGTWSCGDIAGNAAGGEGNGGPAAEPLEAPWSTGFENGFCDYAAAGGYCYVSPGGVFETVTSPVRSGKYAAAYTLTTATTRFGGNQSRCVRGGELPAAAYYSAHFFIPRAPTATANWNLLHFRGQDDGSSSHGLWDVSISREADGSLRAYVYDHLRGLVRETTDVPAVPVGDWFELEVYWKRASGPTGEFALYLDGELALDLSDLVTDDTSIGEWYVGNLAVSLTPADSTLYVDDVSIREEP